MPTALSPRTQITIAVIGAVGALLVALVAKWPFGGSDAAASAAERQVSACADANSDITAAANATVVNCAAVGGDMTVGASPKPEPAAAPAAKDANAPPPQAPQP